MSRNYGEIRIGDLVEFKGRPESSGIITNMMSRAYGEVPECIMGDPDIAAWVIHQASDRQFAVWETGNLGEFVVTFRRKAN